MADTRMLRDPEPLLQHIASNNGPSIYVLCDFHPYLENEPTVIRYLKDIALDHESLAAKAVAGYWGLPLLRLDFGETERNLRNSLKQAELMSPCVLWMDEIEKGLATGESDNATSRRVLSTLLTWIAENDNQVFIVATSNDITQWPPELVRKGRLDEVFFVDLPDPAMRAESITALRKWADGRTVKA